MRLPYLQVAEESWGAARLLARLLGIHRQHAHGLLLDLWAWALEQGDRKAMPTGEILHDLAATLIAGAVEWPGDPDVLVRGLEASGLMEAMSGGVRIRGLERYGAAFRKQEADRERRRDSQRHRSESQGSRRGVAGESRRKTETETDIEEAARALREVGVCPTGGDAEIVLDRRGTDSSRPLTTSHAPRTHGPGLAPPPESHGVAWLREQREAGRAMLGMASGEITAAFSGWLQCLVRDGLVADTSSDASAEAAKGLLSDAHARWWVDPWVVTNGRSWGIWVRQAAMWAANPEKGKPKKPAAPVDVWADVVPVEAADG